VRAVRFRAPDGEIRIGSLQEDEETIIDAGPADPGGFVPDESGWRRIAAADGQPHRLTDVSLLAPVVPRQILAIGLNYRTHAAESELEIPQVPVVFAKLPSSLIGPGQPIVVPREETRPDYEGEVAVVIGRRTYRASREDAPSAIGGITALNDVSGRRAQLETPLRQFTLGKSFDTFTPLGPALTPPQELELTDLRLTTRVSGEVMQDASTRDLIFSIAELIEYLTRGITLEPGDIIATGTPGGVGDSRRPPRYLRAGDIVEVHLEGVGTLRNPVEVER
jgi:2-keto-4-pentenoate hydratase/2-oxohepta-3-ene-1,7-dioic acid hydratase in catechol pathway